MATKLKPQLNVEFVADRVVITEQEVMLMFEIVIANVGSAPARDPRQSDSDDSQRISITYEPELRPKKIDSLRKHCRKKPAVTHVRRADTGFPSTAPKK